MTMRILLLVRGLTVGGAQRQLVALARGLRGAGHEVGVAVFYAGGIFDDDLRSEGIPIQSLSKRGRWDLLPPLVRLARMLRSQRPDVVYAYMSLANLSTALVKPWCRDVKLVWGIRSAMEDFGAYGWLSRSSALLDRIASPAADRVVANSHAARRAAMRQGLDGGRIVVVPNGFDCERFQPDPEGGARQRERWDVPERAALVGVVARLDPVKDHATFLRAAARVASERPDTHFVCVGGGELAYRAGLERLAEELGLARRVTWAGQSTVTRAVYSAFDVAVLSSNTGESFPNVVGEAMACGVPCVVSDTGDARAVVGDTGAVVPPRDPAALARGMLDVIERARAPGSTLPAQARARIERHYSLELMVTRTEEALEQVVSGPLRRPASGRHSAPTPPTSADGLSSRTRR
jgi:glycosyltransferase involved in cell wall biosynthesis